MVANKTDHVPALQEQTFWQERDTMSRRDRCTEQKWRRVREEDDGVGAVSNGRGWRLSRDLTNHASVRDTATLAESESKRPEADMSLALPRAAEKDSGQNRQHGAQSGIEDRKGRQGPGQWLVTLGMCELGREKYKYFNFH